MKQQCHLFKNSKLSENSNTEESQMKHDGELTDDREKDSKAAIDRILDWLKGDASEPYDLLAEDLASLDVNITINARKFLFAMLGRRLKAAGITCAADPR